MINPEDGRFWERFRTPFRLSSVLEAVPETTLDPFPPPRSEQEAERDPFPPPPPAVLEAGPEHLLPPVAEAGPERLPLAVLEAVPDPLAAPRSLLSGS